VADEAQAVARPHLTVAVALLALVTAGLVHHAHAQGAQGNGPKLTKEVVDAGLRFSPAVAPADRQLVLREISLARPEARRLIGIVDGLVTIRVGDARLGGADAVGLTQETRDGYIVTLNLADVWAGEGERGVQRLVLHELGHVVDSALVPPDLGAQLDAEIPASYGCDPREMVIGCAPPPERFAETFAKWCTGDIGVNLPIGYRVAPPASLDDWGAQLVSGIRAASAAADTSW
jgi:hypothetical protein